MLAFVVCIRGVARPHSWVPACAGTTEVLGSRSGLGKTKDGRGRQLTGADVGCRAIRIAKLRPGRCGTPGWPVRGS